MCTIRLAHNILATNIIQSACRHQTTTTEAFTFPLLGIMKEIQYLYFSRSLGILLLQFGFLLQSLVVGVKSSVINCDKYKYNVQHPYQPDYCIPCKICPHQVGNKLLNDACKKKIPSSIPGQGNVWCTGVKDKSPWCPRLSVTHGRLNCTSGNDVYSTCSLLCDHGYMPKYSNWTNLECLESLQWNIPDQFHLSCRRTAKPDKPSISSPGQRHEVRSGSEKALTCLLTSDVVGKKRIYWYFQGKQLYIDSDLDTYVIHRASTDSEGEYFCQVEDETGKSDLSAGYFIKVEGTYRAKPNKPSISSPGQRHEVRSGSEKALTCLLTSDVFGKKRIYWYFKGKQLYSDSVLDTYVIHRASTDSEGVYFCQVEDETGKSDLSAGYFIKVEDTYRENSITAAEIIVIGLAVIFCVVVVVLCIFCYKREKCRKCCGTLLHRVTKWQYCWKDELDEDCLSSVATSLGGSSATSGTKSTSDVETSDMESKQSLISDTCLKSPVTETKQLLPATNKEVIHSKNINFNEHTWTSNSKNSGHKTVQDFLQPGITTEMRHRDIKEDQNDLRSVLKNWDLMKELKKLLDQNSGAYEEKPTFRTLGIYLHASPDELANFEFNCKQKEISPTDVYIRKMAEEGQGLSNLLCFLRQHNHTKKLAELIQNIVLNKDCAAVV